MKISQKCNPKRSILSSGGSHRVVVLVDQSLEVEVPIVAEQPAQQPSVQGHFVCQAMIWYSAVFFTGFDWPY